MNTENFDKLIEHLETLKRRGLERKFNMRDWIALPVSAAIEGRVSGYTIDNMRRVAAADFGIEEIKVDPFECQTVACLPQLQPDLDGLSRRGRTPKQASTKHQQAWFTDHLHNVA